MNVENLLRVADAIEKHEIEWLGFNMIEWASDEGYIDKSGHNCGTTACIAGWAVAVKNDGKDLLWHDGISNTAKDFLGLSNEQAAELFMGYARESRNCTFPEDAARVLRFAAKHGRIDWQAATAE